MRRADTGSLGDVVTYKVGQKKRGHKLTTILLWNLNRFKK